MKNVKDIIKDLEELCITSQQEYALTEYIRDCIEFERDISLENFRSYYANYCYEKNLFNDLKIKNKSEEYDDEYLAAEWKAGWFK